MNRLESKIAIVTGGSRGIGLATARRLAAEGALVTVWDLKPCPEAGIESAAVDVADPEAVSRARDGLLQRRGRIDILINNAGIIRDSFAEALSLKDWEAVLRINLTGTFIPCQAVIPSMRQRKRGRIINTASISAFGNRGQANYSASKAGVIGLTRTLALELARDGITVNCVAPGTIDTAMMAQVPQKVLDKFLARIPLGRLGRPEEVAAVHAFLASDDASFITGQTIICDGGLTIGGH